MALRTAPEDQEENQPCLTGDASSDSAETEVAVACSPHRARRLRSCSPMRDLRVTVTETEVCSAEDEEEDAESDSESDFMGDCIDDVSGR